MNEDLAIQIAKLNSLWCWMLFVRSVTLSATDLRISYCTLMTLVSIDDRCGVTLDLTATQFCDLGLEISLIEKRLRLAFPVR